MLSSYLTYDVALNYGCVVVDCYRCTYVH